MRRIFVVALICMLVIVPAASAAVVTTGAHETNAGGMKEGAEVNASPGQYTTVQPTIQEATGSTTTALELGVATGKVPAQTTLKVKAQARTQAQNATELRAMIQAEQKNMTQVAANTRAAMQEVLQNQNTVRLAVHTLLAAENLTGGIGPQVSQIAQGFNNSVQATINSEERIRTRSVFVTFFAGGDTEAADEILRQVQQNQVRITELNQLMNECVCNAGVKEIIEEQIQALSQEQVRLQTLAQQEKGNRGLFGWLWGNSASEDLSAHGEVSAQAQT